MPNEYFLIDAKRAVRRAISRLRMRRLDRISIPTRHEEIRLFVAVRNETLRLPYFFRYYRQLGVDRFFVIDNNSTDGTREFLLDQSDTHVFETRERYARQESWVDVLLRRYGMSRWCVVVDVDELLVYPGQQRADLPAFCENLGRHGWNAMHAVLLDMYPEGPLSMAVYQAGEPFLPMAPFFEHATLQRRPFRFRKCRTSQDFRYGGGVRRRMFGLDDVCCSKFPLVRWEPGLFVRQGAHAVEGATIAETQGALLHFKFLSDFGPRAQYEAARGEHWNGAVEYKAYASRITQESNLVFWGADSIRYEGPQQLLALGIMKDEPDN